MKKRRTLRWGKIIVVMCIFGLTGCTQNMKSDELDAPNRDLLHGQLNNSLTQQGRDIYAGASGQGENTHSVAIELPLNRDGLAVYAVCAGAAGFATITLNEEGPYEIACGEDETAREITDALAVQGNRLVVAVEGMPAAAVWAVAAVSSNHG